MIKPGYYLLLEEEDFAEAVETTDPFESKEAALKCVLDYFNGDPFIFAVVKEDGKTVVDGKVNRLGKVTASFLPEAADSSMEQFGTKFEKFCADFPEEKNLLIEIMALTTKLSRTKGYNQANDNLRNSLENTNRALSDLKKIVSEYSPVGNQDLEFQEKLCTETKKVEEHLAVLCSLNKPMES